MSEQRKQVVRIDAMQAAETVGYLRQHFDKEKGAYHDTWSDDRIAGLVKCNNKSVANIRSKFFGHLKAAGIGGIATVHARLTEQQALIDWLTTELSQTQHDFRDLVVIVRNLAPTAMSNQLLKAILDRYPDKASIRSASTTLATKQ